MNRTILIIAAVFTAPSLLLVDSLIKGAALLGLAAAVVIMLRRDSAATRHLVWLLAIIAMLAVPVMSVVLPQWRVLPEWAGMPQAKVEVAASSPELAGPAIDVGAAPRNTSPVEAVSPKASANQPAAVIDSQPASAPSPAIAASTPLNWDWRKVLPLVWAIGFCGLIIRLMAARWMLWNTERHSTVIGSSWQSTGEPGDPIIAALQAASLQLGLRRPVAVLIHPHKTIPVVWGFLRCRLLLPAAARQWCDEQLRSVLLHELAHIKRRDPMALLLTQIACALHWFNPLVWIASWRLCVERERACDDLVLTSGVRPSAYAGHLLEIVSQLSPARYTQSCGLAMARKSSLEGRLVAVLSGNLNRRGVSAALAAIAFAIAVGIGVPIAMLRAADEKPATVAKPESQKTIEGQTLKTATEQRLKWGEPVNGLRMALAWPPALGEPAIGDEQVFYLVVQNVSQDKIRLTANDAAPNPRKLIFRSGGRHLSALNDLSTMPGDWRLEPRQVASLRLFQTSEKLPDGRTVDAIQEETVRHFPQYSLTAEMNIETAPAGAWTGKLATSQTRGSMDVIPPKNKEAQALYQSWANAARSDGKIPGGVIGLLGQSVTTFINYNPTWETTPQLKKMLPRFDASRDWTGDDAVKLLDELAALQDSPIVMALDNERQMNIRTGSPLPAELSTAPWGQALANGLRMAWLLEPRAAEHRLGTPLTARILIHNAGKEPVAFRARTWHQVGHKATDAKGAEIKIESTNWLTRGLLVPFRLAPGEFIELSAPGIGIGPVGNREDWQHTRVGTWIEAKAGDEVTVTTGPVPLYDWNEEAQFRLDGEQRWWLDFISARLARHQPFPDDAEARKLLVYRIAMELFGTPVSEQIHAAFVADRGPTALDSLAKNLFHRPGLHAWAGPLISGPTKFRVLPADPDAAKKPRTASNPGHYTISDKASFQVTRRPDGERIVNESHLVLSAPGKRHQITLPDGYGTWAAGWVRGDTTMWITQKGLVRKLDFSDLEKLVETRYEADKIADAPIPPDIREALRAALTVPDAPKQLQKPLDEKPAAPPPATSMKSPGKADAGAKRDLPPVDGEPVRVKLPPDRYVRSGVPLAELKEPIPQWGDVKNDLSTGIRVIGDARIGGQVKIELWVRNSGAKDVTFSQNQRADVGFSIFAKEKDGKKRYADITSFSAYPVFNHLLLPAGSVVKIKEITMKIDAVKGDKPQWGWVNLQVPPGDYKLIANWSDSHALVAHTGDWTGELTSGEVDIKIAPANPPAPPPADGELVYITRKDHRPFHPLDAGRNLTWSIETRGPGNQSFIAIRWKGENGVVMGHDESLASDFAGNQEQWAIGWLRGSRTLWYVNSGLDGKGQMFRRVTWDQSGDRPAVFSDYLNLYHGEPIRGLGIPPALAAKFENFLGIATPRIVDKSGGLPEISGHYAHTARPLGSDGSLPVQQGQPANDRRWKVHFVDRDTGRPAPDVRVRLRVQSVNRSRSYDVVRIVSGDGSLEPSLAGDEIATVEVLDEKFRGGGGSCVFGNVPVDWLAAEKLTDPNKPVIVKVWPTSKDPMPQDDAIWNTKTPFEKIPVKIADWSQERDGLRIGMRVMADDGWRVGGKVKVELWAHNPGKKNVWLIANPGRADVGLMVYARDDQGRSHYAANGNVLIIAIPMDCVLPAGHVAKVKEFTLSFDAPGHQELAWFAPKFQDLKAGKYQLRCIWSDAHPLVSGPGYWTGELTTPELDFTLLPAVDH